MHNSSTNAFEGLADADLAAAIRAGQGVANAGVGANEAIAVLYARHYGAAVRTAGARLGDRSRAEDVAVDAFADVLELIRQGVESGDTLRPSLACLVSRKAFAANRNAPAPRAADGIALFEQGDPDADPVMELGESGLLASAFMALPARRQGVLWLLEIEDARPAEVAAGLGLGVDAVSAVAEEARKGLRAAYLEAHGAAASSEFAEQCHRLGEHVGGALGPRARLKFEEHLGQCTRCSAALAEVADIGAGLRAVVAPLFLGTGAESLLPLLDNAATGPLETSLEGTGPAPLNPVSLDAVSLDTAAQDLVPMPTEHSPGFPTEHIPALVVDADGAAPLPAPAPRKRRRIGMRKRLVPSLALAGTAGVLVAGVAFAATGTLPLPLPSGATGTVSEVLPVTTVEGPSLKSTGSPGSTGSTGSSEAPSSSSDAAEPSVSDAPEEAASEEAASDGASSGPDAGAGTTPSDGGTQSPAGGAAPATPATGSAADSAPGSGTAGQPSADVPASLPDPVRPGGGSRPADSNDSGSSNSDEDASVDGPLEPVPDPTLPDEVSPPGSPQSSVPGNTSFLPQNLLPSRYSSFQYQLGDAP